MRRISVAGHGLMPHRQVMHHCMDVAPIDCLAAHGTELEMGKFTAQRNRQGVALVESPGL
ncbi:hypothetical protein [Sphingomonas psychrotolerans]|uniref:hypothetical protein n=1 Tax=Sphingomonas psychrotolerans TaxID=1327635 RepID=UPI0013052AD6|nr:hypothetical protein [Sphingomonas psychrotolerans]